MSGRWHRPFSLTILHDLLSPARLFASRLALLPILFVPRRAGLLVALATLWPGRLYGGRLARNYSR